MQSLGGRLGKFYGGRKLRDARHPDRDGGDAPESDLSPEIPLTCREGWRGESQKFGCRTRLRTRIDRGDFSDRAWQVAASLFFGAVLIYGVTLGGHLDRTLALIFDGTATAAVKAGLTVRKLTIEGQRRASDREIVKALRVGPGISMLSFDTGAAQERLERLPWVRNAKVMRLLPSTLRVVIEERKPFAVWQLEGEIHLVGDDGTVIAPLAGRRHAQLPLIVGKGAAKSARDLVSVLERHRGLRARLKAAVRVAERRWNLNLKNGVVILLPEENLAEALARLEELVTSNGVLEGAVVSVDLRLPDRATLRLTDRAAADLDLAHSETTRAGPEAGRDT